MGTFETPVREQRSNSADAKTQEQLRLQGEEITALRAQIAQLDETISQGRAMLIDIKEKEEQAKRDQAAAQIEREAHLRDEWERAWLKREKAGQDEQIKGMRGQLVIALDEKQVKETAYEAEHVQRKRLEKDVAELERDVQNLEAALVLVRLSVLSVCLCLAACVCFSVLILLLHRIVSVSGPACGHRSSP